MKKKIEVVNIDKNRNKIFLKEHASKWKKFWKKYNKLILLILLILSLAILATGIIVTISNMPSSDKIIIKEASIDTDLDVTTSDVTADPMSPLTDETAKKMFHNNTVFNNNGLAILVKTVSKKNYIINFYSDYTAIKIMKDSNIVTRIDSVDGKEYGIKENGVINAKTKTQDVTITNQKDFSWGKVTYYSDGSAQIDNSEVDMFVRNANDIKENFLTNNRVSYLKEQKKVKNFKLNYYYDGTIEVIKENKHYIVRNANDINITNDNVTFPNGNEAIIINSMNLKKGQKIDYYSDGSAIITNKGQKISVRKSNSIIIKDNNIYEIVDNIYVEVSKQSGNITYYTNGSAVVKNYQGKTIYVEENSNIKYKKGNISDVGTNYEKLTETKNLGSDKILIFESTAVVETKEYIAIINKENILYDTDGSLKEIIIDDGNQQDKPITITNNTNETIKYRLVIEKSNKTNLDVRYIKYQLSVKDIYIEPTRLDRNIWKPDPVSDSLSITGTNYILLERTLEPMETEKIKLMLWTDYDTIPNSMQNKYFYGTIRIYAWQEIKLSV